MDIPLVRDVGAPLRVGDEDRCDSKAPQSSLPAEVPDVAGDGPAAPFRTREDEARVLVAVQGYPVKAGIALIGELGTALADWH